MVRPSPAVWQGNAPHWSNTDAPRSCRFWGRPLRRAAVRLASLLLVFVVTVTASATLRAPAAHSQATFWPGVVAIKVHPGSTVPSVAGLGDVTTVFPGAETDPAQADLARWHTGAVAPGSESDVTAALLAHPGVAAAERVPVMVPAYVPIDPEIAEQWALTRIGAFRAWDEVRGTKLRLGIIDTQFDTSHPELAPRLQDRLGRTGRSEDYTEGCPWSARYADHGTMVAGVAAAVSDNGRDIAGAAYAAQVVAVQAGRQRDGSCYVAREWVTALRDLATDRVPVVNLSFASPEPSLMVTDVVRYATARGTLVVAAAGNYASSGAYYPASLPEVVSVGAVAATREFWGRSNRGQWVDLVAPGDRIVTTCPGGSTCVSAGTSIAAANVSAAALLLADTSGARGHRLFARLVDAADRVGGVAMHPQAGRGTVRIDRAVTEHVVRLMGPTRVETAIAIARESLPSAAVDRIVVVPGDAPGESGWTVTLPAAGLLHGGRTAVVVTERERLTPAAATEVARLTRGYGEVQIVLPGDTTTGVGTGVEQALADYDVVRVSGEGVAGTAAALADFLLGNAAADRVLVARGDTFADALSLAGPAATFGHPLLFVAPDHVPDATCAWLGTHGARTIHVAGGPRAISDGVLHELEACGTQTESVALLWRRTLTPTVVRDAGASRVETAVAIAENHFGRDPDRISVANGWKWPDAVTGGALAAAHGAPILVLPSDATGLPASVARYVDAVAPEEAFVLGGPVVVSDLVEADLEGRV